MSKLCFVLLLNVFVTLLCTNFARAQRIVGGFPIDIEDAPYQVSLQLNRNHYCGGSVISGKWILTAAHCTQNSIRSYTVRAGTTIRFRGGSVIRVRRIVNHPNYNSENFDYDISLVELTKALTFSSKIQPIALPESNEELSNGTCLVTGWGNTMNLAESSVSLRGANVSVTDQEECTRAYRSYTITSRMICAADKGKDSCQGDSGGPLNCENKLHGIVSWGVGCALPNYPGVYARVTALRQWIKEVSSV